MKLTKSIREHINKVLLTQAKAKSDTRLSEEQASLIVEIAKARLGEDYNKLAEMPEGWLAVPRDIVVCGLSSCRMVYLHTTTAYPRCMWENRADNVNHNLSDALVERILRFDEDKTNLQCTTNTLRYKLRVALNAITTVEKLREEWPEAYELIPKEMLGAATKLPAVPLGDLKAQLAAFSVKVAENQAV